MTFAIDPRITAAGRYDEQRIAYELEETATGNAWFGNAVWVAMDFEYLTPEDKLVLVRYNAGTNTGTDHVSLQDIANRVRAKGQANTLTC